MALHKLFTEDTAQLMLAEMIKQSGYLQNMQGTLTQLKTTNKTSLVAALNEVFEFAKILKEGSGPGLHNSIFRGKNLGSSVTAAQWAAIGSGTFDDLWIGDYWVIGGVNWRIADCNYYIRSGDQGSGLSTNHLIIVPDTTLYNARMNEANVTTGAYVGSEMYTTNLAQAKTTINNAFGAAHILNHREVLANATANGKESSGAWYNSTVELMSEEMVYGCRIFGANTDGSETIPYIYSIGKSQLSLFRLRPDLMIATNRMWYWLRNVVSPSRFARCRTLGIAGYAGASAAGGVRPAFPIAA